jgi:hypothetical protein
VAFPSEGLEANQRGELSSAQRDGFARMLRARRRGRASMALVFAALAVIVALFASPKKASPAMRAGVSAIALAIALALVAAPDTVARDMRAGRVDVVEGAVGKRRRGNGRARPTYFLQVGDRRFQIFRSQYEAAPDAGYVRLYFLPSSRKLVNLEPLPDRPRDPQGARQGLLDGVAALARAHGTRQRNEARAEVAGIAHQLQAMFVQSPARPPPEQRDPRPLAQAIVGRWTNGFITVAFETNGTMMLFLGGHEQRGRWSVGADDRLRADLFEQQQSAEAWVVGDQLTVASEGRGLTLQRQGSGA